MSLFSPSIICLYQNLVLQCLRKEVEEEVYKSLVNKRLAAGEVTLRLNQEIQQQWKLFALIMMITRSTCAWFLCWPRHWWHTLIAENSLRHHIEVTGSPVFHKIFCLRIHILSPTVSKWQGINISLSPSLGPSRLCGTFWKQFSLTQRWLTSRRGRNSLSSRRAILTCGGNIFF